MNKHQTAFLSFNQEKRPLQQSFGFSLLSSVQKTANITFTELFVHVQSEHYTSDTQHNWVWMSVGKYIWNELP